MLNSNQSGTLPRRVRRLESLELLLGGRVVGVAVGMDVAALAAVRFAHLGFGGGGGQAQLLKQTSNRWFPWCERRTGPRLP